MAMMLTMPCQIPRVKVAVMMLDNPSAKQRIMDRMPSLPEGSRVSGPPITWHSFTIDAVDASLQSSRRTTEQEWSPSRPIQVARNKQTGRLTTGHRYLSQMPVSHAYSDITASGSSATLIAGAHTEVSRGELILETHLGGGDGRIAATEDGNVLCGWEVTKIC